MSKFKPSDVERLLVYPGHDCPCCAGRFGFEQALRAMLESHPERTRKQILQLNPLYVRQLPSIRHQEVHVLTMAAAISARLPELFKAWRRHLQSYPELPYLLHVALMHGRFDLPPDSVEIVAACRKISPFKKKRVDGHLFTGFRLKKKWHRLELTQEVMRNFAVLLDLPSGFGPWGRTYLPQFKATYADQLDLLEHARRTYTASDGSADADQDVQRFARRFLPTLVDSAFVEIANTALPRLLEASAADVSVNASELPHSVLREFFEAGGSYTQSIFNIAALVLEIDPELLLLLDQYRNKLNPDSIDVLDSNLDKVNRNLERRRVEAAARRQAQQAEHLRHRAQQEEQEREHQRIEAARAQHRAAVQALRSESQPDMTRRLSNYGPVARMKAIADQDAYAPATFPQDWASEFTADHIAQLDAATIAILIEKTAGVRRGQWKRLHRRLQTEEER